MASQSAPSDISREIVALAENFETPSPVSTKTITTTVAVAEPVEIEEPKTPATVVDSLVRPLVESVRTEPLPPPAAALIAPPNTELRAAEPDTSEPLRPRAETAARVRSAPMLPSGRPRIELDLLPPMATGLAPIYGAETQPAEPLPAKTLKLLHSAPPPVPTPAVVAIQKAQPDFYLPMAGLAALCRVLLEPEEGRKDETDTARPQAREAKSAGPVFDSARVEVASEPLQLPEPVYDEEVLEQALEQQAASVLEAIKAQPSEPELAISEALELDATEVVDEVSRAVEAQAAAVQSVVETFREQPATSLLAAPSEIVAAPAPPATQWLRTPRPILQPCAPSHPSLNLLTRGPQAPTLAGPCLPQQLQHFVEEINPAAGAVRKPIAFPTWLVSVVVATCLFLGAGSLVQYLTASRDAKAASPAPAAQISQPSPAPAPATPPAPVVQEHPLARFVEVAGVRIVQGANRKPQLQYIVVNHSGSDLTGLDVRITGHAADAPSGDPLFSVSQVIAFLGPYQSKEIHLDLDARLRTANIPDWQSLKTEVLIARH